MQIYFIGGFIYTETAYEYICISQVSISSFFHKYKCIESTIILTSSTIMKKTFLFLLMNLCFVLGSFGIEAGGFSIHRGINISHWLSQRPDNNLAIDEKQITEKDFKLLAELGFDHVRIPIDEMILWNESGEKYEKSFQFLHKGIQWAIKHKLRVVVDLHIIRAHYFNAGMEGGTNTLWTDAKAQTHFLSLWEELSAELNGYDTHMLAYEIMNEPTAPDHEDWNKLIQRAYDQIRSLEKKRVLVIGSNLWQGVGTFQYLKVPANDPNIILSCHFYEPFILSHYKASWTEFKDITVPVHYPGYLITKEDYEALPEAEQKQVARWLKEWDKSTLHGYLIQAKKKADELGLNLYCGEFGIYRVAPRADAYRWYKDVIEVFDELNMAWCHWDYKGGYTIFNEDGKVDSELMKAIGLQAH